MSFLTSLGQALNEQFFMGESSVSSLDSIDGSGRVTKFGLLGDFSQKFDASAQRSYIEDGFVRNVRPRMREILYQQPDMAVIIKKRMFSSLVENFKLDGMEESERLFIRASKKLFQNKCRVISAYEKLSKIEALAMDAGHVNSFMFPAIMSGISALEGTGLLNNFIDEKTRATLETLRQVFAFSSPTSTTTWSIDSDTAYMSDLGEGTGTIELTMVQNMSTKNSVHFGDGSASFSVEDPYKLLRITNADIDMAIKDSTNWFKNSFFGRFTQIETQKLIESQRQELNANRATRGASGIDFILSPATIVSKKVRAILQGGLIGTNDDIASPEIRFTFNPGLAGIGSDVDIDPIALTGKQGLNPEDANLFKRIIRNLYLLLAYEYETRSEVVTFNQETNYVRRKMQLHFGGKSMIQPMDVINVFVTSRTGYDEKIIQGFDIQSRGLSFGSTLNNLVRNINNLSNRYGNTANMYDEMEKASIAGADFPTWLWRIYRNDFTRQGAGTCIFVGLVKSATQNYSANEGKYTLQVQCEDNAGYFTKSKINIKPANDVFNSNLYDPLTPFKVSFDGATGDVLTDIQGGQFPTLLQENENLLKSNAVRFHNGRFRGSKVDRLLYQSQDGELGFNNFRQVLNDPLGFVYRWKEGIGSLTKTENAFPPAILNQESSPLLTADPFAGQDVMNVLSLIVTGQPYNYNTFLKAAIDNANALIPRDGTSNDTAATYIDSLTNQLNKRNTIWGNFVPFKKLVINKDADNFLRSGMADFTTKNEALLKLIDERAGLMDQLAILNGGYSKNPDVASQDNLGQFKVTTVFKGESQVIESKIYDLDQKIESAQRQFSTTITNLAESKPDGRITIIGDNIALEPSYSNAQTSLTEEQRNLDDEDFRKRINFMTQRRLWKVKANNNDNNLFIVDDQYDKNFDIQAFGKKIGNNFNIFNSEYSSLDSQLKQVAELLGLEIFADSQGHIQARPPLYNRVPSSVFYRMFRDKERTGFQVFPQFLESLLFNQLQAKVGRLEIVEDEIRIRALAIGIVPTSDIDPDNSIASFLRGSRGNMNQTTGNVDTAFTFVSDSRTGKVGGFDNAFQKFIAQAQPDMNEDFINNSLQPISEGFNRAATATRLFDSVSRLDALKKVKFDAAFAQSTQNRIDTIAKRLQREKGVDAPTIRELFSNDRSSGQLSQVNTIKLMNEISNFVSERQGLLKTISNTLKNLTDGIQLNSEKKGATAALFPDLNSTQSIPGILQHMIEDETNDDWGPGSGQRYIIKERQIISIRIEEVSPSYNLVQVNGLLGDGRVDAPSRLGLSPDGGNAITSAYAVDYDSWRMYGFRAGNSVQAPFFSDPDTQCAPYAVFLLNLARKNILQGTAELVGNEFYQSGDVVYIEDYDLLFYVSGVDHNFNYGGNYTTTLTLRYGHNPGEYIPTILDIVGKFLYKTKEYTSLYRSNRFDMSNGDIPVAAVIFDNTIDKSVQNQVLAGNRGKDNQKAMTQILLASTGALSPAVFTGKRPVLQLRIYTNSDIADESLRQAAEYVSNWLSNPQQMTSSGSIISIDKKNEGIDIAKLNNVEITVVNVTKEPSKTPSSAAWDSSRLVLEQQQGYTNTDKSSGVYAKQLDNVLYAHIIDAWLTFEDVPESISTGPATKGNQAYQENQAKLQAAAKDFAQFGRPKEE